VQEVEKGKNCMPMHGEYLLGQIGCTHSATIRTILVQHFISRDNYASLIIDSYVRVPVQNSLPGQYEHHTQTGKKPGEF
jgi:hypothetical protein